MLELVSRGMADGFGPLTCAVYSCQQGKNGNLLLDVRRATVPNTLISFPQQHSIAQLHFGESEQKQCCLILPVQWLFFFFLKALYLFLFKKVLYWLFIN